MSTAIDLSPPAEHDPEPGWGQSLGGGAPGIALLHIHRAQTGTGAWSTVQRWANAMTRQAVNVNPNASLYAGAPAVAYALHAADQPAYGPSLTVLDTHIGVLIRHRLDRAHQRITRRQLPVLREFDLISGLTGLGAYLLQGNHDTDLLREVLSYLVRLSETLDHAGEALPGWWTSNGPDDRPSPDWPGGHGNLGMAHGIAGPLALLSAAMNQSVTVPGHRDAMIRICAWLDQWCGTAPHPWWPGMLSRTDHRTGQIRHSRPQRPSWCYGTPGQARAQQLAGLALGDTRRQQQAEAALIGCVTDERQLAQLSDASLCHGWAGLLHTTRRVAANSRTGHLHGHLTDLAGRMREHLDQHGPPDCHGLLEGATGVQLVAETDDDAVTSRTTRWDACLLLTY